MFSNNIKDYLYKLNNNNKDTSFYNLVIEFEKEHFIPAVRLDTAFFLSLIVSSLKPKNILEIGFGSGVSALFMTKFYSDYNLFVSLERDNNRFKRGVKLLEKLNKKKITLLKENAFDYLKNTKIKFDFVFLDAVKREYIDYIEPIIKILNKGSILVCDNIFFNNKVTSKNLEKKYKDGVKLLEIFNNKIATDSRLNTSFFNIGDGISVSIVK